MSTPEPLEGLHPTFHTYGIKRQSAFAMWYREHRPHVRPIVLVHFVGGPKDGEKRLYRQPPREMRAVVPPKLTAAWLTDESEVPSISTSLDIVTYRLCWRADSFLDISLFEYRTPDRIHESGVFTW